MGDAYYFKQDYEQAAKYYKLGMEEIEKHVAKFSFLMVLVPILGEAFLELIGGEMGATSIPVSSLVIGFIAAFVSGYLACTWMIRLDGQKQADIYRVQWKEIIYNYLKEKRYGTAISFAQKNISWTSFEKKDILNIILSCVVGVIPSFMIVVYSIYDLKFNRFKKDII